MALKGPEKNYTEEELEGLSSGRTSAQQTINSSALRKAADKWGGAESIDGRAKEATLDESGKAELDVLNILKQVRSTNPHLQRNNLLEKRIEELEEAANPMEKMRIQRDIGGILSKTYSEVIRDKPNELYFRKHADAWSRQIKGLGIKEQVQWLENVDIEREKRKAPFDALEKTLSKVEGLSSSQKAEVIKNFHEQMAEQKRHDNLRYVETVKANVDEFNRLSKAIQGTSKEEQEQMARDFLNISTAEQKLQIEKLREMANSKHLDNKFTEFNKERQEAFKKEHGNFFSMSKAEKESAINRMYDQATSEYRESFNKGRQHFTKKDFELFEQTIRRKDISLLEASIKDMPKLVRDAEDVHQKSEKKRKEFEAKAGKEVAKRVFDSVGWNDHNTTTGDRKKIIESGKLDGIFKGEEVETREKNDKQYGDNIEKFVGEGAKVNGHTLMHKRGREANKKWFKSLDTQKQNQILAQAKGGNKTGCEVGKSIEKRKKINQEHGGLPNAVQKEMFNAYENLGMEEREALNKRIARIREENAKRYDAQLKTAGQKDLIPDKEKTRKKLGQQFGELSLKEQSKRREKDRTIFNPQLEASIKAFKGAFATLPFSVSGKALIDLNKKDEAHERIAFIRTFLAKHHSQANEDLNKDLADIERTEFEQLKDKSFKDNLVDETARQAEQALEKGNTKIALDLYKKAAEMDPNRQDIGVMAAVLEESEYKDAPIPPSVMEKTEQQMDELLKQPETKESLEMFKLLDEAIHRVEISERKHQNVKDAETRMQQTLKESRDEEAITLQEELSDFESEKGKTEKTTLTKEDNEVKTSDVLRVNLSEDNNDLTGNDGEKTAKRRELIKDLRKKQGGHEGLDKVEFTDKTGRTKEAKEASNMREQMANGQKAALTNALQDRLTKQGIPKPLAERAAKQMVENRFEKEVSEFELNQMAA